VEQSSEVNELASALAAAQVQFPVLVKARTAKVPTKSGTEYSYRYVDLAAIVAQITPILAAHGLAVVQMPDHAGDADTLTTMVLHTSGQWVRSSMRLHLAMLAPQAHGSAITYARRYALCAALGIVADVDDDGAQTQRAQRTERAASAPARHEGGITAAQSRKMAAQFSQLGITERSARLALVSGVLGTECTSSADLTSGEASRVIAFLDEELARA
jgi:hypothetical protein